MNTTANTKDHEMLTPQGVADYLNISLQTTYRYLNDTENPIPSYKFSKKNIRVKKSELDLWVAKNLNNNIKIENLKGGEQ